MAIFKIIAGDFGEGTSGIVQFGPLYGDNVCLKMPVQGNMFKSENIAKGHIASLDIATEQHLKKMPGAIGWGLAGGLAFGAIGAVAGILAGGRKTEVVFICVLSDGRKFLGQCDSKTFLKLQGLAMAPVQEVPNAAAMYVSRRAQYSPSAALQMECMEERHRDCNSEECSCGCHAAYGTKARLDYEAESRKT